MKKWYWSEDKYHGGYSGLFDEDDNPVCVPQCENDGDDGAAWFNTDGDAGEETLTEWNATLIAAAPEMLELLKTLEYANLTWDGPECAICGHQSGHAEDCGLGNLLARLNS